MAEEVTDTVVGAHSGDSAGGRQQELDDVLERVAKLRNRHLHEVTPDELLSLQVGTAAFGFDHRLRQLRDAVLADAERRDKPSYRPPRLASTGLMLNREERALVEERTRRFRARLLAIQEEVLSDLVESVDLTALPSGYPAPKEMVFSAVMLLMGPARCRDLITEFAAELATIGEAGPAYGQAYFAWLSEADAPSAVRLAVIPAAVAEFESLLGSLLRVGLRLYPEALGVDAKSLTIAEFRSAGGLPAARQMVIDRIVREYLRESVVTWDKRLARWPGIALASLTTDWPAFVEIFARRNAIVHSDTRADENYRRALVGSSCEAPAVGMPLDCDVAYTLAALDHVAMVGNALSLLWLPTLRSSAELDTARALDVVYDAVDRGLWTNAQRVFALLAPHVADEHVLEVLRVNNWLAMREASGTMEAIEVAVRSWEPSPDDPTLLVAKAALLRDVGGVERALRKIASSGGDVRPLSQWPLLRLLAADHPRIRSALSARPAQFPATAGKRRRR